ncbi:transmembrane channel-like protein [Anopheles aquasalis]|uniref:transmembrane channel-like protein n=1 Tax=Anopheles aquasalis TaxID=42839 RepID=UPI00215B2E03|nr:transmembrane channel-like protein [Anopheles aquasalis]
MSDPAGKRIRKRPSGILKLEHGTQRRRESSGSSLLQLGDEHSPSSPGSISPQLSVTWAFPPIRPPEVLEGEAPYDGVSDLSTEHQHPVEIPQQHQQGRHTPTAITSEPKRYNDGNGGPGSRTGTTTTERPSKATALRGSHLNVLSAARGGGGGVMKTPDATPESALGLGDNHIETDDDEDYSASLNAIIQRKASVKKKRGYKGGRRTSSPVSQMMGFTPGTGMDGAAGSQGRRRSSAYTTSSVETGLTLPEDSIQGRGEERSGGGGQRQDKLFETIRLHKEVLQTVKLQPISMKRKLRLVQQAKSYITRHEGALQEHFTSRTARSLLAQFSIFLNTKWQQLLRELANLATYLIPWESRIKEIESRFGSVVASYFTFLRWLFSVNIVISVLLLVFIMVPEEIYINADKAKCDIRKTMSPQERALMRNFSTIWEFEGPLKYSILFYGYYSNFSGATAWGYKLPLAYFVTGLVVYIYSFVATLKKMAQNSRMSKLSSKDDEYVFSWKLFTGWDYMIGHLETAQNRMASIILGFKEALLEEAEKKKDTQNWKIILLRILVNLLILGLLVISAYEVILVVKRSMDIKDTDSWWRRNETTVVMSLISFFFPMIFEALGMMEYYHPRKQLRIQLARIMVLNMLNLYSLIFALFDKIAHMTEELRRIKPANFNASDQCFVPDTNAKWSMAFDGAGGGSGLEAITTEHTWHAMVSDFSDEASHSGCYKVTTNCSSTAGLTSSGAILTTLLLTNLSGTTMPDWYGSTVPSVASSSPLMSPSTAAATTTKGYFYSSYGRYDYNEEDMNDYLEHRARLLPNDKLDGVPINKREAIYDEPWHETDGIENESVEPSPASELPVIEGSGGMWQEIVSTTTEQDYVTNRRYDDLLASYYYSEESTDSEDAEYEANQFLSSQELGENTMEHSTVPPTASEPTETSQEMSTTAATILSTAPSFMESTTSESATTESTWTESASTGSLFNSNEPSLPTTTEQFADETTIAERAEDTSSNTDWSVSEGYTESGGNIGTTEKPNLCYHWVCPSSEGKKNDSKYHNADIRSLCWETMFGQELAKLTVMDLLVTIISTLILDFVRALFVRYMNNCWCWDLEKKFPKYGDFKIAENILHLVNNQGMVWMGMFFSPGLAVLNIVKLVIILYLRSWTVLTCNVPHEVVFRASRSNNFYFALLLTMLFLCVLPVSYAIVFLEPSWHCGPFSTSNRIYHLLTDATDHFISPKIAKYIVSPAAIIPLLVLLILIIYYLISLTGSLREANQDLKLQLRKERTEERRKMFKIATSVTQQQQQQGQSGPGQTVGINGLSSSWNKVLDSTQLRLQSTSENVTDDNSEHSSSKHKELLQRMMKKALQKEHSLEALSPSTQPPTNTATPTVNSPESALPLVATENEKPLQRASGVPRPPKPLETGETGDVFRFDRRSVEQINAAEKKSTKEKEQEEEQEKDAEAAQRKKFERNRPSTADRFRAAALAERRRTQNKTADWIEKIPVITISKTSSDECIIDSDDPEDGKQARRQEHQVLANLRDERPSSKRSTTTTVTVKK